MVKKIFKIIFILYMFSGTMSLAYEIGSMTPGTAGWDYNPQGIEQIAVTCNIPAGQSFNLSFSIADFNSGDFIAEDNVRLKVYYIGSGLSGAWVNNETSLLTSPFDGYSQTDPFVEYDGTNMQICSGVNSTGVAQSVKLVLAVTVYVPADGKNMVGSYSSDISFVLNNGTITAVEPN